MTRLIASLALVVVTCACSQGKFESLTSPTSNLVETPSQQVSARTTAIASVMVEGRPLVWTSAQGFNPRAVPVEYEESGVLGTMPKPTTRFTEAYIETSPNGRAVLVQGEILKASWASPEVVRCEGSVDGAVLEIIKTQDFLVALFMDQGSEWRLAQLNKLTREELKLIDPTKSTPQDLAIYRKLCS